MTVDSERVARYLADDPDPDDRARLEAWVERHDEASLEAAFGDALRFGTSGLRGVPGPGPARLNTRSVLRAGRAALEVLAPAGPSAGPVVVGFDARPRSRGFAEALASLASAGGFDVVFADTPTPTPELVFFGACRGAVATFVATASHNPPADVGLKVYGPRGVPIVPPTDTAIEARIADERATPRPVRVSARVSTPTADDVRAYERALLALHDGVARTPRLRVAYTALHGVGARRTRALASALDLELLEVPGQCEPDGLFPGLPNPNPEHTPSLQALRTLAETSGADLALAHDPDADRLALIAPGDDGAYWTYTGDELGLFLADAAMHATSDARRFVLATHVSASALGHLAAARGIEFESTATGHKWIAARRAAREASGERFLFGYEEALGYAFPTPVYDKDGLAALVAAVAAFRACRARGETPDDALARVARSIGLVRTRGLSVRMTADARARLEALERAPGASFAGRAIARVEPRAEGGRPFGLVLADGLRVRFRPSGTEPKLKAYLERTVELARGVRYRDAVRALDDVLSRDAVDVSAALVD